MKKLKYRTIDLCAGIGGIRRGFEMTGRFENVLSAEIDAAARKTYKWLYDEDPECDLTTNEFKNKTAEIGCDVLLAGFPCQTFSSAGLQAGFEDEKKGVIFFHILEIMKRCTPKAVFLENVENLLSHDEGNTLKTIIESLEFNRNYKVIGVAIEHDEEGVAHCVYTRKSFLRNTKEFGLPQNRPRVYIMAFSRREFGKAVDALKDWTLPERSDVVIYDDVNAVLDKDVDDHYYMASGYLATLKRHKVAQHKKHNGFGYAVVNELKRADGRLISNTILATGGSGKECNLIRQHKDGVAGKEIPGKRTPINDEDIRVMTPTEWGRLQGFIGYAFLNRETGQDGFSFPPGTAIAQQYKQFGNSVSVPVMKAMAEFMLKCFDEMEPEYQKKRILGFVKKVGHATRKMIAEHLEIDPQWCSQLLKTLVGSGDIYTRGKCRGMVYTPYPGI